ncbi:MAG: hypothetical protein QE263_08545 [Vampirovibrionales bacterium]|nr:hypothetical protein [Vampirovibrionales bacterium]
MNIGFKMPYFGQDEALVAIEKELANNEPVKIRLKEGGLDMVFRRQPNGGEYDQIFVSGGKKNKKGTEFYTVWDFAKNVAENPEKLGLKFFKALNGL